MVTSIELLLQKLLLMSILGAVVVVPMRAAKRRNARAGLRQTVREIWLSSLLYLFAVIYLYPRI